MKRDLVRLISFILITVAFLVADFSKAARLKDLTNIRGVRENQLIGYGIVVGLNGTGDSKAEFTSKSMLRMLESVGMKIESKDISSKNVAAVIVTGTLPPFARSGNKIDIVVNSIGDATSLEGGVLVQTPLRAANQQVYAVAQGTVMVGGAVGGKIHGTSGRMLGGAIVERDLEIEVANKKMFRLTLNQPDFTTAARISKTINEDLGGKYANATDSSTIDVVVPARYEGNAVEFIAIIESLEISPDQRARVVINEKTGTVVIGNHVRVHKVALSHGSISLSVGGAAREKSKDQKQDRVFELDGESSVGDLVKALNGIGVTPKDLISILQSIKAAGAIQADVEIL